MCSEGKRVELGEALECLSAAFREWDEGPARGTVLEHEARRQEVWRSARLVTAAWRKGEGRPALVGEDAEAPVCGGPTDAFDVAPPDAPCPVPPKPEPECCTEEPKVCPLYPDCPEDCVAVFGTRCSLTDQLQRLWRGTSGNRTIIDAMSRKLDRLDKGLADLKQRFEEHIAL